MVYQSSENLNYQFRLGAQHRTVIQGAQTSYTAYGTAYSLNAGLTSETYHDAEVGFKYLGGDGMNLKGSLGGFSSDLTTSGMTAHLWLNWAF